MSKHNNVVPQNEIENTLHFKQHIPCDKIVSKLVGFGKSTG